MFTAHWNDAKKLSEDALVPRDVRQNRRLTTICNFQGYKANLQ